jgi:replication initiation protein RepC
LPLSLVLKSCPDILDYAQGGISDWYDMVATAHFVRGMMGISPDAWENAQRAMGPENAAVVLACMLQRVADIHSPGGYLRALTNKSTEGAFSPGPMVMALLNGGEGQAA